MPYRCSDSVKHYKVVWDGRQFVFGLGKFPTLEDFKLHFAHNPVISSDSGTLGVWSIGWVWPCSNEFVVCVL